jgi:transposase
MMRHIADCAAHIYLALGATDFRKQQNGLVSLVALKFKLDPHSGANFFLFCNKRHNALRALRWDGNGFILATKSLSDEIKFQWPKNQEEIRDISRRQLEWLLSGLQVDQKKAHPDSIDTFKIIY